MLPSARTPAAVNASRPSSSPHTTPSIAARARCSRVVDVRTPVIAPDAFGRLGVRSPSKYGTTTTPPAPAGAASASASSAAWSTPSQRRDRLGHLRGVERADERKEAAGCVGESGDRAGRVGGRRVAHRVHGSRRSERDRDVARLQPEGERGGHVVAGTRGDDRLGPERGGRARAGRSARARAGAAAPNRRPRRRSRAGRAGTRRSRRRSSRYPTHRRGRSRTRPRAST